MLAFATSADVLCHPVTVSLRGIKGDGGYNALSAVMAELYMRQTRKLQEQRNWPRAESEVQDADCN